MSGNTGAIILIVILLFVAVGAGIYVFTRPTPTLDDDDGTEQPSSPPPPKTQPRPLPQVVSCKGADDDALYKVEGGKLRKYPSMEVLRTWVPHFNHGDEVEIDCVNAQDGPNMKAKTKDLPKPSDTDIKNLEGKTIICQGDSVDRYRMEDSKLRKYPSMDILRSWDPDYTADKASTINCEGIPKGTNMAHK